MAPGNEISGIAEGAMLAGRYRLIRKLGSGGMAMVWLAEDERLSREVAVKIPSDVLANDRGFLRRFRREARVAAKLTHPNLVAVYDYSSSEGRPFLVMQYVEGDTLADRHERGERIDARELARELLGALEHIHAAGIVHRDVKPSNVLLTGDGRARLTDFGIAQPADATRLTETGLVIGSKGYLAPEVLAGDRATPRSDLYSCGMVLSDHVGPREPASLRELVADLTAEDPRDRPAAASDALAALERPTQRQPVPRTAPTAPLTRAKPRTVQVTPRQLLGALLAIGALVGFVALVSGGDDESPQPSPTGQAVEDQGGTPSDTADPAEGADGGDPAEGARLNQEGFQLIQQGRPEEAVPILEQAVASFPQGTSDLNRAYALFNLGQALRLSGRPDEAIPILEERLETNNQRAEVQAELEKARAEAGD